MLIEIGGGVLSAAAAVIAALLGLLGWKCRKNK